jgi:hypothetical protein
MTPNTPIPVAVTASATLDHAPTLCRRCRRPVELDATVSISFARDGQIVATCVPCVRQREGGA